MADGNWCMCGRLNRAHNHEVENGCPEDRVRAIDLINTTE